VSVRLLPLIALVAGAACPQPLGQPKPAFEVSSIRVTPQAQFGYTSLSPFGANRYTATNATLDFLIRLAYGIPYEQISGIEKLGSQHYNVTAKAEDGVLLSLEQLKPRLQRLLEERFKLAVHREMKVFDGYELVVAKGGSKLKPSAGGSEPGAIYPGGFRLMNQGLDGFAATIRSPAGRPVINKTGLDGNYDFELRYARDGDVDSALPSFFTALQQEFGLKLEPGKVHLDILVIDHVDRVPAEN